ncbi:MAG: Ig-like domain-containing protein [Flavobacteriaceae bacterium]|nr:Ig-like domain-containing protein [Flavobacteriaceae bacterium]
MKISLPPIKRIDILWSLALTTLLCLSNVTLAQTQAPSVTTGVTFQWSDTQSNNNDPATISSITIDGVIYNSFAAPTSYNLTRLGPNGHNRNNIIENGTNVNNNSSNVDWNADAIAAFQDKNLNHYFNSNDNGRDICNDFVAVTTTDAQIQSLYYAPGIPSNDGGIVAITERNANNCYYVAVYGYPLGSSVEVFLGDTFVRENSTQWGSAFAAPPVGVDYWNSGRVVENGGSLGIAIFSLEDLAPVGSIITRVDLMAATQDHGDGKFFIAQKYTKPKIETSCLDQEFNGTVNDGSAPLGSTYTLASGPTPAGQSFTFNSNGTYSYTPTAGYLGDVTFDYEVCLPAPNSSVCDENTVTIEYVTYPDNDCPCNSGDADGPLLQTN